MPTQNPHVRTGNSDTSMDALERARRSGIGSSAIKAALMFRTSPHEPRPATGKRAVADSEDDPASEGDRG